MRWLVNVSHQALSRLLAPKLGWDDKPSLTGREVEVLKWTADGKTAGEISDLLAVSEHTVNFHVKNAVAKLQTANKTAAVVRAAMLGLLS
jgi:LuxR family transcriptional regulator